MVVIENDPKLDFRDVLIRPKRSFLSSRKQVNVERSFTMKHSGQQWTGVPIIAANMDSVGTFEMAKSLSQKNILTAVHKHYTIDQWKDFAAENQDILPFVAVSSGIGKQDGAKLDSILNSIPEIKMICIDVANGYSESFVQFIRETRKKYSTHTIMAGNVVTQEMTEELIMSGADIVKVGIGPGSVCTTRRQTGVGYPQLSAVIECADAAHGLGGRIISDGGCACPGDLAKAFGGGADFVMLGGNVIIIPLKTYWQIMIFPGMLTLQSELKIIGMLAGHDESGGDTVEEKDPKTGEGTGQYSKIFYGMSSDTAMKKHVGGVAEYRSSEGKTVKVPYRGPVYDTVNNILGGIRSTCTYVGAAELRELPKRTTFIRVTMQLNETFGNFQSSLKESKKPSS